MGKSLIIKGASFEKNSIFSGFKVIGDINSVGIGIGPNALQSTAFYTSKKLLLKSVAFSCGNDSISDFVIFKEGKLYKTIKSKLQITGYAGKIYTLNFNALIEVPANSTFGFTNVYCNYRILGGPSESDGYSSDFDGYMGTVRKDINWDMEATILTID